MCVKYNDLNFYFILQWLHRMMAEQVTFLSVYIVEYFEYRIYSDICVLCFV